jgi:hypothetical protein
MEMSSKIDLMAYMLRPYLFRGGECAAGRDEWLLAEKYSEAAGKLFGLGERK